MPKQKDDCKHEAGKLIPIINLNKCEGKKDCVDVCPYNVFEMHAIDDATYAALSFKGKVKTFFKGKQKAFAVNASECHACGLCVTACPEKAIQLAKAQ
ncbi:MAG: ferredoxin family protein [Chitinophagales bacterium]|nr:ferredoxin family protein [Chitinophagales bacterium]